MMCDVTECPSLTSGYCDLVHRAELCATFRSCQPAAKRRFSYAASTNASRARKADRLDPIVDPGSKPRTYPVDAVVYASKAARCAASMPAFLREAHIRSRAAAWRLRLQGEGDAS